MTSDSTTADDIDPQLAAVREHVAEYVDRTVRMRRTIHRRPELGNELPATQEVVLDALDDLPIDVTTHETTSGVVGLLE